MRTIDLKGTSEQRGEQQGEELRAGYDELMKELLVSSLWKDHKPPMLPNGALRYLLSAAGRTLTKRSVRKALPVQYRRVRGLANGFGTPHGYTWGLQFLEVVFCEAGSSMVPPGPNGCTVMMALPEATREGRVFVGRNYDFPNLLQRYQVVRRETPTERGRYATITVTQLPLVGAHQGINERGLVVTLNNARLWRGEHLRFRGVPASMLLQEALETCATTAEAVQFLITSKNRANAGFFGIVDASGAGCLLETTAASVSVRHPQDGILTQANHFHELTHVNVPEGTRWEVNGMVGMEYLHSSRTRQQVAERLLRARAGDITVATLKGALSDHSASDGVGTDITVCCHGDVGSTLSSLVFDVGKRTLHVADGTPCTADWQEVQLA
jgi:isopenicillin-N N-acyltransferase like protein